MKILKLLGFFAIAMLLTACSESPVKKAFDMTQKGEPASKVAKVLLDNKIDYDNLTTDEFAELCYTFMYISTQRFIENGYEEVVDEEKLSQIASEANKALQKLPPEKKKEVEGKSSRFILQK